MFITGLSEKPFQYSYLGAGVLVTIGIHQRHDDEAQLAQHIDVARVALRQLVDAVEGRADADPLAGMGSRFDEDGVPALVAPVHHRSIDVANGTGHVRRRRLLAQLQGQLHVLGVHPVDLKGPDLSLLMGVTQRVHVHEVGIAIGEILQILVDLLVRQVAVQDVRPRDDHPTEWRDRGVPAPALRRLCDGAFGFCGQHREQLLPK